MVAGGIYNISLAAESLVLWAKLYYNCKLQRATVRFLCQRTAALDVSCEVLRAYQALFVPQCLYEPKVYLLNLLYSSPIM